MVTPKQRQLSMNKEEQFIAETLLKHLEEKANFWGDIRKKENNPERKAYATGCMLAHMSIECFVGTELSKATASKPVQLLLRNNDGRPL